PRPTLFPYTTLFRSWENDLPDWDGPILLASGRGETASPPRAAFRGEPKSDVLLFVGGGKDSLVAAHLLEEAGVSWASNTYAHSRSEERRVGKGGRAG